MKIERLSQDKIRIFLTFDDLQERGIQKEDMWREIPKVHDLFSEMMDQAYNELGFDASGPLAVEVFALPAQGMVVIVTRGKMESARTEDEETEEDIYEMEVTLEQSDVISYAFHDFEMLLSAVKALRHHLIADGSLYSYKGKWILQLEPISDDERRYQAVIAILSEYGEATSLTSAVLAEYGKLIVPENAVYELSERFK
ncbi:MAG TPA: genetic competence negative regulator [Bacilli bacterium]